MFNWLKRETRQGNLTDEVLEGILARAQGSTTGLPGETGALEIAAGFVGRAFAVAQVETESVVWADAFTPELLTMIGRSLIRSGEFVGVISTGQAYPTILAATEWEIAGGAHPATWGYNVNLATPSGLRERELYPGSGVVHIRYATAPMQPWHGLSPLQVAVSAGKLSAEALQLLIDESATPRGYLLPIPGKDGGSPTVEKLRTSITALRGKLATVETQQTMMADQGLNKRNEWETRRIGSSVPETSVMVHERATLEVVAACGVPRSLFENSDGAALREGWRMFLFGTLAPIARYIESEVSRKLETPFKLNFDELRASDLTGRARAFQSMVQGGMALPQAAQLSGLLQTED